MTRATKKSVIMSKGQTLAFIAGTLADAIRPGSEKKPVAAAPAKTQPVVFLADNSRLQRDAHRQRDQVEALCKQYGLKAEWPSEHFFFPTEQTVAERMGQWGIPIDDPRPIRALRNAWIKIVDCDAMIAEVTPFRGPHVGALVAFEIGVAVAAGIPVFAYTASQWRRTPGQPPNFQLLDDRIWCGDRVAQDGNWRSEEDGTLVENYDLVDHAQIAGNFTSLSDSREAAIRSCAEFLNKQGN